MSNVFILPTSLNSSILLTQPNLSTILPNPSIEQKTIQESILPNSANPSIEQKAAQ